MKSSGALTHRCPTCRLPVSMSKRRRELLRLVDDGRWHDASDNDLGRLEALAQDGLVFWVDCKPPDFSGGLYRITERGRELLDVEALNA